MVKILLQIINYVAKVRHGLIHQNQSQKKPNKLQKKTYFENSKKIANSHQCVIEQLTEIYDFC